ncbi:MULTISPECIES: bifunctional diguanylate cyclase/phosphodiesterase [Rahnella]|jgi:diguanylate cyclase (GGDEF)-like protein/PAS domain S-box-containing protein|uniref:diguanylate cyclase n=1 Tax=Rahnella sp. (strain Y9602) TaxID=2703885 RepID=A0A0H3FAH8_RAHSY|nr:MULTISPECIES: EAL domain-containing protein [Rahnella]AYA07297.1 GGDEF domain-containing protein [Rahnella aquatilis]ADW74008.1 diguanylate cyclase/phosphodiesterase with PAS/PAC sensor(s) [Rahnella aceris]AZP42508.1 EAL domain-containing protein [Rahnella aquatilis]AZP46848.1 EAL domain-containing protein [Rahnella aquatilis]AZP51235.1 EAL domain-containing protein [Rahnella aquatilis]
MSEDSDVLYRLLVQRVEDYAIYMLTPDGHIANWNAGAQRAKGYTPEEVVGKHFSCFYTEEDRQNGWPQRGLETARSTGRYESEGWRQRKDGSRFWAHIIIEALREAGEIIGFAKITRDVTERRETEKALLQAKELAESNSEQLSSLSHFLNTVIANIPSSVIVENAVSREILLVNRQAERLLGIPRDKMLGKRPQDCMGIGLSTFINKQSDECLRAEGLHRSEQQLLTAIGDRTLQTTSSVIRGHDPQTSYVMMIADDVTDQQAAHARIHHMAHHDNLTSLPNRILFSQRLSEALQRDSYTHSHTATLCLDLDNFKNVNDALGHQVGDELLRAIAKRLRMTLRDDDTLARIGGDEFAVVLPGLKDISAAHQISKRLIESVRPPVIIDGHSLSVGLSIGIALAGSTENTPDQLLRCADMALYEAKRNGRNRYEDFRLEMDAAARKRRVVEMDLRDAITCNQLRLYYQPITDARHDAVMGYEALMRWHHPENGLIMPVDFIPIAEETGLIHSLGSFALHEACREAASWKGSQTVAVNLSPIQFKNSGLLSVVESALEASGLDPSRLEVEITESVLLDNTLGNISTLRKLKSLGVRIALDDFGTGYSSLSYLRSFPFDKIKIDRSFINDMHDSREALAIIRAITGMSRSLDIQTTAEGVETDEQFRRLKEEGCTLFQGYFFGRPQPSESRLTGFAPL